ncbi:MAG TPA: tRNA (N6-threonylcarbamoyladenosine(37)-N6)-methyltransferase TrmO [Synergistales bacterium]|nr:tRNA (N6-threonylcarbamoyladenosine(37)-N6)-methyltransferase TrmO [Synergistales bacterium]
MTETILFHPIGYIRTPFRNREGMPVQPPGARGIRGEVVINPLYVEGLKDLEGFSHIYLIYHFHCVKGQKLTVTPFMDVSERGLFATRAPCRPNPIGLSVVRLIELKDNVLIVEDVDIIDGTPLLDIKPFVPFFDVTSDLYRTGWLEGRHGEVDSRRADSRFNGEE